MQVYGLSDQAYTAAMITEMVHAAGFGRVDVHGAWDQLALKDAPEWMVYVVTA